MKIEELTQDSWAGGGWAGLGVAVLVQAVMDAQSTNGVRASALSFLHSRGCHWLVSLLGVSPGVWNRVMESVPTGDYQLELPSFYPGR